MFNNKDIAANEKALATGDAFLLNGSQSRSAVLLPFWHLRWSCEQHTGKTRTLVERPRRSLPASRIHSDSAAVVRECCCCILSSGTFCRQYDRPRICAVQAVSSPGVKPAECTTRRRASNSQTTATGYCLRQLPNRSAVDRECSETAPATSDHFATLPLYPGHLTNCHGATHVPGAKEWSEPKPHN